MVKTKPLHVHPIIVMESNALLDMCRKTNSFLYNRNLIDAINFNYLLCVLYYLKMDYLGK